jgi:hypothetical protein
MIIKSDFELEFDPQKYIAHHGDPFKRLLENMSIRQQFDSVLQEAKDLCQPVACYDVFPITKFKHDVILLADGTRIGGGPVVNVMAGAQELIVGVCSLGSNVDVQITTYSKSKEWFKMMILDELATWGVDQVRLQLVEYLGQKYESDGWRTSTCLSPGESEWSVKEQAKIFKLLVTQQIGVSLSEGLVMYPLKSLSLIIGAGHGPLGVEGLSNCDFCSLKERCRYQHLRAEGHNHP